MTATAPAKPHQGGAALLRIIGVFKLLKGAALIIAAFATLHLRDYDLVDVVDKWSRWFHVAPGNKYLDALLIRMMSVTKRQLALLAAVLAFYAAMFITEGVGLVLAKRWAEWMTVITTAGLIPLELNEFRKADHLPLKFLALAINVAILLYLIRRVRRKTATQN